MQNGNHSGAEGDQRPRRRRKKSVRYQGFDDPFTINAKNGKNKEIPEAAGDAEESTRQGKEKPSRILLTLPLNGKKEFENISQWKRGGSTAANVNSWIPDTEKRQAEKPVEKAVTVNKNSRLILRINGVAMPGNRNPLSSPSGKTDQPAQSARAATLKLPMRRPNGVIEPRRKHPLSTESSSDEKEVGAKIPANGLHAQGSQNAVSPSRTPQPATGEDTASSSSETNSKADQEHLRMDHADVSTGGIQSASAGGLPEQATKSTPPAKNSQTVYELLNRMSSLEGHVQSLQMRVGPDDGVIAGEDASAAALKAAVQNLARAAQGFAKSRDYETRTISAGIDTLWPEPGPGLEGADCVEAARRRECARSIARQLVWTAAQNALRR